MAVAPGDPGIVGSVQPTALSDPAMVERAVRVGRPGGCRLKLEKSLRAASLRMLIQEPDVDPARVPEAARAPISRHRRRNRYRFDGVADQPSPSRQPLCGLGQLVDLVRTDDIALAPIAESGPGGVRVIERRGQLPQGLLARGPAQQSKLAELPDRVIEIRVGVRWPRPPRGSAACGTHAGARRRWPSMPGPRRAPSPRFGRP